MLAQNADRFIVNYSQNSKTFKSEHTHSDFHELYFLVEGKIINNVNGVKQEITSPAFVFVRENDLHYIERIENCECCFYLIMIGINNYNPLKAYLSIPDILTELESQPHSPVTILSSSNLLEIENCIKKLLECQNEKSILFNIIQKELIFKCFSLIIEAHIGQKDVFLPLWFKDTLLHVLDTEVIEEGISALVKITGKSNPYLCKYFKKYLNTTPSKYINDVRLEKSAVLLRTSDMEIIEVALDVGFDNLSYFYHVFRQKFHISPAKYRNMYKNTLLQLI